MGRLLLVWGMLTGMTLSLSAADSTEIPAAISTIQKVGREGTGNTQASKAWKILVSHGGKALIPTLIAFQDSSPAAANWLRSAVDAMVQAETLAGRPLPADTLAAFCTETKHAPAARRIAYELLEQADKPRAAKMLPEFINDSSLELRRDAIAERMTAAEKVQDQEAKKQELQTLLTAARDQDQIEELAKQLEPLGVKINLAQHMGFISRWHVVGPFESTEGAALSISNPPEAGVDLTATYTGKDGAIVRWQPLGTAEKYAELDLNKRLGRHKNASVYAYSVVHVDKETPVELRAATQNAIQIFVNGKKAFEREEYHHGTKLDQHAGPAVLKAGKNEILVKICQNDQKEQWAQVWQFQVRICDATGGAVPFRVESPTEAEAPAPAVTEPKKEKE